MSKILKVNLVDGDDCEEMSPYLVFSPRLYEKDYPNLVKRVHDNAKCVKIF